MSEAPASALPSIWQPPLRRLTLGLTLVSVASAFEALAVATIMPTTLRELGGLAFYGWTFSAFTLANLVGISVGGSESGRFGLARLFGVGTALFCVGLVVSACAPAMAVIVAGRVLQGFGAGLLSTVAYASIALVYAHDLQPRMLATLSSAWVIPGLVSPGLAGVIAEQADWRWVFAGLVPLPLMAAVLVLPALRALPRSTEAAARSGRIGLAVQLGVGAGVALSGLGLRSWLALPLLAAGGSVAVRALRRLVPTGTLSARVGQPAAIASVALITFAFFGSEAFVPLALSQLRHAPIALSGLPLTAAALTWTAGAWLPVRWAGRVRRSVLVRAGLGVLGVGIAGTSLLLVPSVPAASILASWALAGLGMGLAFTTSSTAILEAAAPGESSMASAALQLAQVLGSALATGIGGALVSAPFAGDPPRLGIALVDLLMLIVVGISVLAARGIPGRA
jgi:MFS family permease